MMLSLCVRVLAGGRFPTLVRTLGWRETSLCKGKGRGALVNERKLPSIATMSGLWSTFPYLLGLFWDGRCWSHFSNTKAVTFSFWVSGRWHSEAQNCRVLRPTRILFHKAPALPRDWRTCPTEPQTMAFLKPQLENSRCPWPVRFYERTHHSEGREWIWK